MELKEKGFFFLDKCTGILDESQEQEPQKQPQEASEAAEDLSVYEEMYKRGDWSCFMCSKWFGRKDVLRQHLVLHYKKQLGKQFVSKENNPEKNICGLCQFQAKDPKALIQHIALGTHLKKKIEFSYIFKFFYVFRNFSLATFISNFLCFCAIPQFRDIHIFILSISRVIKFFAFSAIFRLQIHIHIHFLCFFRDSPIFAFSTFFAFFTFFAFSAIFPGFLPFCNIRIFQVLLRSKTCVSVCN